MIEITIIIATYNSEKLIVKVLDSIRNQTLSKKKIEILAIDGGSKDDTLKICKKYGCKVLKNPRTEPVYGKFVGFTNAKGRYVMYLDHDEVLNRRYSLENRLKVFKENQSVKALVGSGYKTPKGSNFITHYINEFGDPFSSFVYRLSKDYRFLISTMNSRYELYKKTKEYNVYKFRSREVTPIFELVAAGGMFDKQFLIKSNKKVLKDYWLQIHASNILFEKEPYFAVLKNDYITHYASESFRKYLYKIAWRVKNNTYHKTDLGMSGFSGRQKYQNSFTNIKKYLFLPYTFFLVPLIFDSIFLSITRSDVRYLMHVPLSYLTALMIVYHGLRSKLGYSQTLKNYDGTKEIK